jgi:hypothetical protein
MEFERREVHAAPSEDRRNRLLIRLPIDRMNEEVGTGRQVLPTGETSVDA